MDPAIISLQKTGYYVHYADGTSYHDEYGHGWFSKQVARDIARALSGMYFDGNRTSIKEVVIGYVPADAS